MSNRSPGMFGRARRAVSLLLLGGVLAMAIGPLASTPARSQATNKFVGGQILVASDKMSDPRFTKTVVFVVRHDQRGAFGLIVNRPVGDSPLDTILQAYTLKGTGTDVKVKLYAGGPVEPRTGYVLHSTEFRGQGTQRIGIDAALSDPKVVLPAIAQGKGPRIALVTYGYTGWQGGQLEAEIADGAWMVIAPDSKLLFDTPDDMKWAVAFARRGVDL